MYYDYFNQPGMEGLHIFEFSNSPYASFFYEDSLVFERNKKRIGVVDQFQGKRPAILNKDFLVNGKQLQLCFVQTLILDSHVIDGLHRFVSGAGKLDDSARLVIIDFLKHVSRMRCDYSPVFYLVENFAKSPIEQFIKKSSEKLCSLLKLHCMDEEIFIESNRIELKSDAVEYYCSLYKASDLDGCAVNWVESFLATGGLGYYENMIKVSYACLLKMVLLHFMDPKVNQENVLRKNDEFETFLCKDLKVLPARELSLALYYFSNLAGRFVNVQSNMGFDKAVKNLKATAWDLLLLRLPEFLLTPSSLPEVNTAYVVTSEEKLLSVGNMFGVESIYYPDLESKGSPLLSFKTEVFESIISKEKLGCLWRNRAELSIKRAREKTATPISDEMLDWLIEDLENQMRNLCT